MIKWIKTWLRRLFTLGLLIVAVVCGWFYFYANQPLDVSVLPKDFIIKSGSSLRSVARQLVEAGVLREPWQFILLGKVTGNATEVKAGNYELETRVTPYQLLAKITRGDFTQSEITLVEGWSYAQWQTALKNNPAVRNTVLDMSEAEVLKAIGAKEAALEGLFYPDTYFFASGGTDISVLKRAYTMMQNRLASAWAQRVPGLPYATPYEALIMASIIEKETGRASDRSMVAAVFINRLRLGMKLQTDPTVIYGMGKNFSGNLHKADLLADTPYNTYTRTGLPPTPIAMPGLASLTAALHPADSKALYFVAKGDGASHFSSTLDEHNRAVNKYLRSGASR